MKQTEITVQVLEKKEDIEKKLKEKNFVLVENYLLKDYYFSKYDIERLKTMPFQEIIKNSFLVRDVNNDVSIIYKNKEFDEKGDTISEVKKRIKVNDKEIALELFLSAGLTNWCKLTQDIYCYKNEEMEILVQYVDSLGAFIEYEEDQSVAHLTAQEKLNVMIEKLKSLNFKMGSDFNVKKVYQKFKLKNNL